MSSEEVDFDTLLQEELKKYRATEAYALLDKEFGVEKLRLAKEWKENTVLVDRCLLDDYFIILKVTKEEISQIIYTFKNENIQHYAIEFQGDLFVILFLDSPIDLTDKQKLSSLLLKLHNFNGELFNKDISDYTRPVRELFTRRVVQEDTMGRLTLPTNHVTIELKENNKKKYRFEPSKRRILII
jgi:hypothetical protein